MIKIQQLRLLGNVIEFPNKIVANKKILEKKEMKEMVNMLIDNYEGDFHIIFRAKEFADIFTEEIRDEFIVATTNKSEAKETIIQCSSKAKTFLNIIEK